MRMVNFWINLIGGDKDKLSFKMYQYMLNLENFRSKWLDEIKSILIEVGRYDVWQYQNKTPYTITKQYLKQTLLDLNLQNWRESLNASSKGKNYSIIKESIALERYLTILSKNRYSVLVKFRTGNHFFPIETDRWLGIELNDRKCSLCDLNDIGDEIHYLLICPFFEDKRKALIKSYYYKRPNILKFKELLTTQSVNQLHNLCRFITCLFQTLKR